MKRPSTSWIAATGVMAIACATPLPEPASVLPRDAPALVVFAPPARIRESLRPFLDRLPEASGIVDLTRSIAGIDLADDAGTRDNGLDPKRGPALAWWEDAILVVLPLKDEAVGLRRLRLRLARLGFLRDETGPADRESFRSLDQEGRVAVLESVTGLAVVCIGTAKRCHAMLLGTGWDPQPVIEELANGDPVAVGVIRNPILARLAQQMGLPVREPGVGMVLALLGDARWAIHLEQGVRLRVVAGPSGLALAPQRHETAPPAGLAAAISIAVPPGMVTAATRVISAPWNRWTGEAGVAVLASGGEGASPLPADWFEVFRRMRWVAALRFWSPGDADMAARALNGGAGPEGSLVPAPGGTVVLKGISGIPMASRADGDVLFLTSEAGGPALLRVSAETMLLGGSVDMLMRIRADPGALLDAVGGGRLEYLGHMVRAVGSVGATLTFQAGRWVLDLEAGL